MAKGGILFAGNEEMRPHVTFDEVHNPENWEETIGALVKPSTKTTIGLMSASDKAKLDGLNANDYVNGVEVEYYEDTVELNTYAKSEMSLDNIEIRSASTTQAGVMSKKDKVKLDGIESGAQKNPGVVTTSSDGLMSAQDKSNLEERNNDTQGIIDNMGLNANASANSVVISLEDVILNGESHDFSAEILPATEEKAGVMSKDDKKFVESSKDLMTNPDFLARTIGYKTSVTSGDNESYYGHLVGGEKIVLQIIRNTGTIKISFGDYNITTTQRSGWYQSTEVPNLSYGSPCDIEAIGGDCEFVMYIK